MTYQCSPSRRTQPTGLLGTRPSDPMPHEDKLRIAVAIRRAEHLWPGPIGEWLADELIQWAEWGHRLGPGTTWELVAAIEDAEVGQVKVAS
jgi:hypothetical protein